MIAAAVAGMALSLAACAAADTTTLSAWLPVRWTNATLSGSVVGAEGGAYTVAIPEQTSRALPTEFTYDRVNWTFTLYGATSVAMSLGPFYPFPATTTFGCTKATEATAPVTCRFSTSGFDALSSGCSSFSAALVNPVATERYTYEFSSVDTYVVTRSPTNSPTYCQPPSTDKDGMDIQTFISEVSNTYQLVITAGAEKLSATTAARSSTASVTGTAKPASTTTATATAAGSGNLGAPARTAAPAYAALGVALGAYLV